jgi:hypothetical protein
MTPEIKALIESLGEPVDGNQYTIKPIDGVWWIEHNNVGSSEPLEQWMARELNPLRKMFFDQFNNCVENQHPDYFGQVFWINKTWKKWVFNYDQKYPTFLYIRNSFWHKLETQFGLNHEQTKELLKPLVNEAFKKKQLIPTTIHLRHQYQADEAFKKDSNS